MNKKTLLVAALAAGKIGRAAFGMGAGAGLLDDAFSAPDAPNGPNNTPTGGGSASSMSSSPSPNDAPPGHDSWLDFLDWATWTTAKNLLPAPAALPIEVLEMGPTTADTLQKVKANHDKKRWSIDTDFKGDSHLTGRDD